MSNVTPIRPGEPTQPPLPMKTDRIGPEVARIHEAAAVLELAEQTIQGFSGDEDNLEIVEKLSNPVAALRVARSMLIDAAGRRETVAQEAPQAKSPD